MGSIHQMYLPASAKFPEGKDEFAFRTVPEDENIYDTMRDTITVSEGYRSRLVRHISNPLLSCRMQSRK